MTLVPILTMVSTRPSRISGVCTDGTLLTTWLCGACTAAAGNVGSTNPIDANARMSRTLTRPEPAAPLRRFRVKAG